MPRRLPASLHGALCAATTLCACPDGTTTTAGAGGSTTETTVEDPGVPTTTAPDTTGPTTSTTLTTDDPTTTAPTTGEPTTDPTTTAPTTGEPCPSGTAGCACLAGQTCDDPLVCEGGVCVESAGVCGDGAVDPGEGCDDGPDNGPGQACKADCTVNVCGDSDVGPGETCDDGNQVDGDGCGALCTAPGALLWEAIWDPNDEIEALEIGLGVACDGDGRAIAVGEQYLPLTGVQALIVAFDASGQELWFHTKSGEGTYPAPDSFAAVATDSTGSIYAVGRLHNLDQNGTSSDWMAVKYSPAGDEIWIDTRGEMAHGQAFSVRVDAEDDVLVGGIDYVDPGSSGHVVKYSPDMTVQWGQKYAGDLPVTEGLAVTAEGDYGALTDDTSGPPTLRKLTATGDTLWTIDLEDAVHWNGLTVDGAGRFVAVGTEYPGTRIVLRQLDADGAALWTEIPDQVDGFNDAYEVEATADGAIYVAGRLAFGADVKQNSAWLRRYDPAGEEVWTIFDPADPVRRWHDVAICPDGGLLVVGYYDGPDLGDGNLIVRKYAP